MAKTAIRNIVSVDSMSGAPRIAPTPTSSRTSSVLAVERIATIGTMVSGRAVPTAAKMEPVMPSEILSRSPRCSRALVKISAPIRITSRAMTRMPRVMSGKPSNRDFLFLFHAGWPGFDQRRARAHAVRPRRQPWMATAPVVRIAKVDVFERHRHDQVGQGETIRYEPGSAMQVVLGVFERTRDFFFLTPDVFRRLLF